MYTQKIILSASFNTDQVHFIRDDDNRDLLFFSDDQKAVQHAQAWVGIRTGKHQHNLVWIGKQDLFVITARSRRQAEK